MDLEPGTSATSSVVNPTINAKSADIDLASVLDEPEQKTASYDLMGFLRFIAIVAASVFLVRVLLFSSFNIPSESMQPRLQIGDYLFVNKFAYGWSRYSLPFDAPLPDGRIWGSLPERGDVVVIAHPVDHQDYIKRVIGLPGDRVQVTDGELYLNRKKVPREIIGLKKVREGAYEQVLTEYTQTLPEGAMFSIYEASDNRPLDNTEEFLVPEGHYFMMGDNRDNSQDSRVMEAVGFVPYKDLVGRASFIFFSTDGSANLAQVWKWPFAIRYSRIFDSIAPVRPPESVKTAVAGQAHAATP